MDDHGPSEAKSLVDAIEALRADKAAGASHATIESRVRELRGQIYSVQDPVERMKLVAKLNELLKPF